MFFETLKIWLNLSRLGLPSPHVGVVSERKPVHQFFSGSPTQLHNDNSYVEEPAGGFLKPDTQAMSDLVEANPCFIIRTSLGSSVQLIFGDIFKHNGSTIIGGQFFEGQQSREEKETIRLREDASYGKKRRNREERTKEFCD
uniref:Uncharacterized protein n=1 Tax=Globodera rostochiensis TaxID=31243 RepID=A0A914H8W8_GLORO